MSQPRWRALVIGRLVHGSLQNGPVSPSRSRIAWFCSRVWGRQSGESRSSHQAWTKAAAQQALDEVQVAVSKQTYVERSRMTVGAYMKTWLAGLVTEGLAPTTIASYKTNVVAHIVPRLGSVPLEALTPGLVKEFYSELLTQGRRDGSGGLSARTVNYVGTILGKALRDAEAQRLINRSPALGVRKPRAKAKASKVRTWSADQLRVFLEKVADDR